MDLNTLKEIKHDFKLIEVDKLEGTLMAKLEPETATIYIQKNLFVLDYYFCIFHEYKHLDQYKNGELENYKTRNECENLEEYNLQYAELAANAFAWAMVNKYIQKILDQCFKE